MPLTIVKGDITRMRTDAIVNAANTELRMGGGVCGAIFRAAGVKEMRKACAALAPIRTSEAVITPGFALQAKYVIHTAGPVYDPERKEECRKLLEGCYHSCLALAEEHGCRSIAFPLISAGIYGYPEQEAMAAAIRAIHEFLGDHEMDVYIAVLRDDLVAWGMALEEARKARG